MNNLFLTKKASLLESTFGVVPGAVLSQACSGSGCYGPGFGMMGPGFGYGGWGIFGGVFMLLFWALIIVLAVYLIKHLAGDKKKDTENEAMKILMERYARGEITKEELEKMKSDIKKS